MEKALPIGRAFLLLAMLLLRMACSEEIASAYLGGGGVKISRLLGSGFGLGFGAFFTSLRPLSLFPMGDSVT